MKRLFVALIISTIFLSLVFSDETTDSNTYQSRIITAYKLKKDATGKPDIYTDFRLVNVDNTEFTNGASLVVPASSRGVKYSAFSWNFYGNAFCEFTVKLTFSPMYHNGTSSTEARKILPYTIKLCHDTSKIGNAEILVNRASSSPSYYENEYSEYRFFYADSVSFNTTNNSENATATMDSVEIVSQGTDIYMFFDMSKYTAVKDSNNETQNYKSLYISSFTSENRMAACHYWNRVGHAEIVLEISGSGTREVNNETITMASGTYSANVIVEIQPPY